MKIIVQHPDRDVRALLTYVFGEAGWTVVTAVTLHDVVDFAQQVRPDVVILEPWEDGSLFSARQRMNPLWEYAGFVAFGTTRSTAGELKQLSELRSDLTVDLPTVKITDLPATVETAIAAKRQATA